MRVKDIMTTNPVCCNTRTNLAAAAEMFWVHDCGALPVLDDIGRAIGIVTDRDCCIALGTRNQKASEVCVGDVMPHRLVSCTPETELPEAVKLMETERVRRLLVIDGTGCLQGILSVDDVFSRAIVDENDLGFGRALDALSVLCAGPEFEDPAPALALLIPEAEMSLVALAGTF